MVARAHIPDTRQARVERAVRQAVGDRRLVLAVSGGRDSMAMLYAIARVRRNEGRALVATFDHGTGKAATAAAALVARHAAALGLPVVIGHTPSIGASEAAWRHSRLAFLADVAARTNAAVAMAHTRDDQVETVLMRVMRDAGARGLAGLYATSHVIRPLLHVSRADVAGYTADTGVDWVEDPMNVSPRFLRNRVRRDLLPALVRARPGFEIQVLEIARRAAEWRTRLDVLIDALVTLETNGTLAVAAADLGAYPRAELAVLWPAMAARAGLAMDWRGTERAAAFTSSSRTGSRIQLSGGWEIVRTRDRFLLRRWR